VLTVGSIGGLTGAVLLGTLRPTSHKMARVLVAILAFSLVGRVLYGMGTTLLAWTIALFVVHLCIPFIDGYAQSIWQEKIPPAAQGRVFSASQFIESLTVPLAALAAGPLVDRVLEPWMRDGQTGAQLLGRLVGTGPGAGTGLLYVLIGVLGVVVGLVGFAVPGIRRLETLVPDHDAAPPRPAEPAVVSTGA
jgi:hypothetical protein